MDSMGENTRALSKKGIIAIVCAAALVVVIAIVLIIKMTGGKDLSAIVMRLLQKEGTVSLTDDKGQELSLMEDMKFQTGYAMETGTDGQVKIGLDDTKIVSLLNDSQVDFVKNKKALELALNKGKLYFNIKKKLDDDESFDVRTSTMVVGVRGTSALVDSTKGEAICTDGVLTVTGINPVTRGERIIEVHAGEKIVITLHNDKEGEESVSFNEEKVELKDLPVDVLQEIASDPELLERVAEAWEADPEEMVQEIEEIIAEEETANNTDDADAEDTDAENQGEEEAQAEPETPAAPAANRPANNPPAQEAPAQEENTETANQDSAPASSYSGGSSGGSSSGGSSSGGSSSGSGGSSSGGSSSDSGGTSASESEVSHKITVTSGNPSGGSASSDFLVAGAGERVTITATPESGYVFSAWIVEEGGVSLANESSATTTFTMGNSDVSIIAEFGEISTQGATVSFSGSGSYSYGNQLSFGYTTNNMRRQSSMEGLNRFMLLGTAPGGGSGTWFSESSIPTEFVGDYCVPSINIDINSENGLPVNAIISDVQYTFRRGAASSELFEELSRSYGNYVSANSEMYCAAIPVEYYIETGSGQEVNLSDPMSGTIYMILMYDSSAPSKRLYVLSWTS